MRAEDLIPAELFNFDPQTGFPRFSSYRIKLLSVAGLARLFKDLTRSLGEDKMDIILARFGYDVGMAAATVLQELYQFDSFEELLKASAPLALMSGSCRVVIESVEYTATTKKLRFSGHWTDSLDSHISQTIYGSQPGPSCHTVTGLLSGYATTILGKEVLVRETACQATGAPRCTFDGRSADLWNLEAEDIRRYFAIDSVGEEMTRMKAAIQHAREEMVRQQAEIKMLRDQNRSSSVDEGIIFRSASMANVLHLARRVAPTDSTVLIQGESGTGKEVLADFIHRHSERHAEPLLAVNCAALPPALLESELFGHVRGAFTGADSNKKGLFVEAGKGTLFLDEVGEIPLEIQAKLLRALQEKEIRPVGGTRSQAVQARIIAATNRDLREMVATGTYREDLYYRLAVFPLTVTPLRQRRQDILILARHFLSRLKPGHPGFSPEAVRLMEAHEWPGNVRELENWVEYGTILAGDERIQPEHLPQSSVAAGSESLAERVIGQPTLKALERQYILKILEQTGGNKTETARILGISQSTLWRRLKEIDKAVAN